MNSTPKPKTVLFSNQKGGVGKTTLARELGIALAEEGKKLLIVDADPQGNLSKSLMENPSPGLYDALEGEGPFFHSYSETLKLLSGDKRLSSWSKRMVGEIDAYERLRELIRRPAFKDFDYIFIDTPPSLGILTVNAYTAGDFLVIPMNPRIYSMQGASDLLETVNKVKKSLNPNLEFLGVIINAIDTVPVIMREIETEIRNSFRDRVFGSNLSKTIKIEEACAARIGVIHHRKLEKSRAKDEVISLTTELVTKTGG